MFNPETYRKDGKQGTVQDNHQVALIMLHKQKWGFYTKTNYNKKDVLNNRSFGISFNISSDTLPYGCVKSNKSLGVLGTLVNPS